MSRAGIRLPLLPFAAVALQVGAGFVVHDLREPAVLVSHALVAGWLGVNALAQTGWRRVGVVLALAGWLLNLAVMLPNGGMPVSPAAEARLGVHGVDVTKGHRSKHVPLDDRTVLAPLADRFVLSPVRVVYSAGDVLLAAGLVALFASVAVGAPAPDRVELVAAS